MSVAVCWARWMLLLVLARQTSALLYMTMTGATVLPECSGDLAKSAAELDKLRASLAGSDKAGKEAADARNALQKQLDEVSGSAQARPGAVVSRVGVSKAPLLRMVSTCLAFKAQGLRWQVIVSTVHAAGKRSASGCQGRGLGQCRPAEEGA